MIYLITLTQKGQVCFLIDYTKFWRYVVVFFWCSYLFFSFSPLFQENWKVGLDSQQTFWKSDAVCFVLHHIKRHTMPGCPNISDAKFAHPVDMIPTRPLFYRIMLSFGNMHLSSVPATCYLIVLAFIKELCLNYWFHTEVRTMIFRTLLFFLCSLSDALLWKKCFSS